MPGSPASKSQAGDRRTPPEKTSAAAVSLARLAVESGGTLTERMDDSRPALDRAVGRLSCFYALGFQGEALEAGRRYPFTVHVSRRGLRAVHAQAYLPRTDRMRRESLIRAAYFSPESFDTGAVHVALQHLEPASPDTWKAQLVLEFVSGEAEFGAVVTRGSSVVHRVSRSLAARSPDAVTFLEPVVLPPGSYTVTAVLTDPDTALPRAQKVSIELPPLPRQGAFLVGPLLGRRGAGRHVVRAGENDADDVPGKAGSFTPLVGTVAAPADLVALTQLCNFQGSETAERRVVRMLRSSSGMVLGTLDPAPVTLEKRAGAWCGSLMDVIPAAALRHRGEYVFEARFGDDPAASGVTARFSVE